jgi:CubicO group peptidase (beta-lactamase class C family)
MRADTPVRAASISKLVTALTAQALERQGVVDLDAPIAPRLGFEPVSPAFDAALERVTLRMALAHTSGLCDPDPYWAPLGRSLQSLLGPQALCDHAPGEGWAYANINYALVAQALETATGERFDILAGRLVLDPLGLDAGFNWSGVSTERRAGGATLYRRHDGLWTAQIDDAQSLAASGPAIRRSGDDALDLADYTPGTNGTLFSPQGGLRASVTDLARLAAVFAPGGTGEALTEPVWIGAVSPGVRAWGSGPQIMTAGQTPGRADLVLVGHAGEAYGLYAGAWAIASRNAAVAFAVTGTDAASDTRRDDVSGLTHWEAELLAIALDQLDALTAAPGMDGSAP